jgi:hypothetical protein
MAQRICSHSLVTVNSAPGLPRYLPIDLEQTREPFIQTLDGVHLL